MVVWRAKFVRGADAYSLGKVCFQRYVTRAFMPGARKEIGLVERRVLMCLYQGLLKLDHVREFFSTGKKELYLAVFF